MPFELRPHPHPTLLPEGEYLQTAWRSAVYPLAERLGVKIRLPDVSPQPYTRLAHEGTGYAKDHGKGGEYAHRVFAAFFQESRDIGKWDVLVEIARDAGLDGDDFGRALETGAYGPRHENLLRQAYNMGIDAVPAFLIGREMLIGLQTREDLEQVIARAGA
jgi:predicted DsbA family dithiol-disulfide isomerase